MVDQLRAAGLVVYRRVGQPVRLEYLLLQTSYGQHHWTPPKGHVDPGEGAFEAALRETLEEAGLEESNVRVIKDFSRTLNYVVRGRPKTVEYWLAELKDPNTKITLSDEHQDYKWLALEEACIYSGFADFQRLLRECEQFLTAPGQFGDGTR